MDIVPYYFSSVVYYAGASVEVEPKCNAMTFCNIGTTDAMINAAIPLHPGNSVANGEAWTIGGNKGEILTGRVDISFPAGEGGAVLVVQKYYLT